MGMQVAEDGRNLVEASTELAAIRRAQVLRGEGESYRSIARILDVEGHRPRRATKWQPAVIRRMVQRTIIV